MEKYDSVDSLILAGAIEPAGIDQETGEILYSFTKKLEKVNPALHREVNNMFNDHVMKLWEMDILDINLMDENPLVRLTNKAFDSKLIKSLNDDVAYTLKEIKRNLSR